MYTIQRRYEVDFSVRLLGIKVDKYNMMNNN